MKGKTCCFTGHRPQKLPWGFDEQDTGCIELKKQIKSATEKAIQDGYNYFISGMALWVVILIFQRLFYRLKNNIRTSNLNVLFLTKPRLLYGILSKETDILKLYRRAIEKLFYPIIIIIAV